MEKEKYAYDPNKQVAVFPSVSPENRGFEESLTSIKPPTAPPLDDPKHEQIPPMRFDPLGDQDLRDACLRFVNENSCYGSRFVRDATLADITNTSIYHYQLETFGEERETMETTEPFEGQFIDGPNNGPVPLPWDIPVPISAMFKDNRMTVEVPHTAYVKPCYKCVGNCRVRCESCSGRGGSGSGNNRSRCWKCSGTGQVKCKKCDGRGNLRHFTVLMVKWTNHVESYVTDASGLAKHLVLDVQGTDIYKEQNSRVYPLVNAPEDTVNIASTQMIDKHAQSFPSEFIRQQRHKLRAVPVTKARYIWKQKQGDFFVYGLEGKVFFEDYPQKCCCCTCF